jgi:dihydrofolate reductase
MKVIGIAAITIDGFIARHSLEKITWSKDLELFKKQTLNHTIIMGSNTKKTLAVELENRQSIVVHREDDPKAILDKIKGEKCFIIGGGRTFSKFAEYLTHLYLTLHPLIFGEGIKIFESLDKKIKLKFEKQVSVLPNEGVFQLQFSVKH